MQHSFKHIALTLLVLTVSLALALIGVRRDAEAAGPDIYLGNTRSDTTVYFVSDWFCPGCRKVEPVIEKMYPEIARTARIAFVDYPIHPETTNFTPYHLQFLIHEKEKYIHLRKALDELSRKTNNPSPGEVQAAIAPLGVTLRQLDFMESLNGKKLFDAIYRGFGLKATPTVVVENSKTKKRKVLVGNKEITRQAVLAALKEMER